MLDQIGLFLYFLFPESVWAGGHGTHFFILLLSTVFTVATLVFFSWQRIGAGILTISVFVLIAGLFSAVLSDARSIDHAGVTIAGQVNAKDWQVDVATHSPALANSVFISNREVE
ncbi:MAG: hypothetical protein C9356_20260 [Oleiphilus sp.]|nr:MAG: hypothetical protein C9356_20260 [Oleiphilus sp.]